MKRLINEHDLRRFKRRAARGYPREVCGILSIRKRNIYKVTELEFWRRNTVLPVKFKTFRPSDDGQSRSV
jgi:hypothetical protein